MKSPINVLILEDSIYDAELTIHELKRQLVDCTITHVQDQESFIKALQDEPDILLADYALPQFNAKEALQLVKESGFEIPVIVISGTIGEEVAVEMMRQGASDYLMKDRLGRLSNAVQHAIESNQLRLENQRYTRELEESTARYQSLFEDSPISLWEEDFSKIKEGLDHLKDSGVTDLRKYFDENPTDIQRFVDLRIIKSVNQATVSLYEGASRDQAIQELRKIFTEESLGQFKSYVLSFYEGATTYRSQAEHLTIQGNKIHVLVNIAIAPGYETNWEKVFVSVVDQTEQILAQKHVVESEALLSTVINSSPDSIIIKDHNYRITLANNAAARTLNSTIDEMIGKDELELGYENDFIFGNEEKGLVGVRALDKKVLEKGLETQTILPVTIDGQLFYFEAFKKPLRNITGEITSELVYSRNITGIMKAQNELTRSEELLRTIINSTSDHIMIKDKNFRIIMANRGAAETLNMSIEEMIGKDDFELGFSKESILGDQEKRTPGFRSDDLLVLETGQKIHQLYPIQIGEATKYFDTFKTPLRDNTGEINSILIYSRDITPIITTQIELQRNEDLLRSVFDSSLDWIFVKDKNHRYVLANKTFADNINLLPEEIVGKTDAEIGFTVDTIVGKDSQTGAGFTESDDLVFESMKPLIMYGTQADHTNGKSWLFDSIKSPLVDNEGNVWGVMGVSRDITERRRTALALEESQKKYEALFNALSDGIFVHDFEGNISLANPIACERLGYTMDEMLKMPIYEIDTPEKIEEIRKRRDVFLETGRLDFQTTHRAKDGSTVPLEVSSVLVEIDGETQILSIMRDITERLEADAALRASEEQYRVLFDTVPDVIVLVGRKGHILHGNQAMCELSGYSYPELIQLTVGDLTTTDPVLFDDNDEFIGGENGTVTLEIFTKDKKVRLLELTGVKTEFGGQDAFMVAGRDQTDRIIAEQRIQESEELLRIIIETIPQPIFVYDEEGSYVMVNQNLAELFQIDKDEFIGNTNFDLAEKGFIRPEEAKTYHENAMIPLMTHKPYYRPIDVNTDKDGIKHYFQIYTTPMELPDRTMRVVGVGTDITEQMQARERLETMNEILETRVVDRTKDLDKANRELAQAKEQIEAILEYSPDAFMLLDADTNIQLVNPSFTKMLGNLPADMYGKPLLNIVHDVNYELINALLNEILESKQPQQLDFKAIHINGSTFECALSATPIIEDENIKGIVINLHDITTQIEVQRMKDAFVSNVSHELRTPITNFICNLELIRLNPGKQDVYLGRLDQEIVQLKNIIEDLLRLSRFDQEATPIRAVPIDINQICKDFTSLRSPLADQKNLSLAFIPQEGLPIISGDYGLISQVLSILLTNAINYTQESGEIIIRSHGADESHLDMIGFSVTDNGPGIASEDMDRLFERFYRGQAAHDSNVSGTGLGLPIAHEIITRHGGVIEVFSNDGSKTGAKFVVWLPVTPNTST